MINKTKKVKKLLILNNLNHYRDFISMTDISKIIILLYKKKYSGVINIGRGEGVFAKRYCQNDNQKVQKKYKFDDNKKITYLVANNSKLKRYFKFKKI